MAGAGFCVFYVLVVRGLAYGPVAVVWPGGGLPGPGGGAAAHFGEPFALLVDDWQISRHPRRVGGRFRLQQLIGA